MGLRSWFDNLVGGAAVAVPLAEAAYDYEDPDLNLPGTQAAGNWRRITQAGSDLAPFKQDQMQNLALYLSDRNPLARGILDLIVSFVVGEGFVVRSKDDDVQKAIDRFWDDAQNDMDGRAEDLTRELAIYGEQLVLAFVNEDSGRVALVSVDPRAIRAVAPHPTASDRPYAVGLAPDASTASEHRWVKIIEEDQDPGSPTFGLLVGAASSETLKLGERAVPFYQPPSIGAAPDSTRLVGCFFWAINKPRSALRGRSDLLSVADNVDMLDQFLFDEGQRMSFQRVFAWWRKITGADETTIRRKAAESTAPKPGGVLITNESEEWSVLAPNLNTQDSQNYADLQISAIATAVGMPKLWLNGSMDTNRATAGEMQEPGLKRMVRRQKYVTRMIERLVRFALDQAELAGTLKPSDDGRHPFTVSTPEMSSRDLGRAASSLLTTTQALAMATAAHWLDTQTAQDAVALLLGQLGLAVDMAEVRDRLAAAAKDAADAEAADPIPDYFGMGKYAGSDTLARALSGQANGTNGQRPPGPGAAPGGGPDGPVVPIVSPAAKDVAGIIAQVSKSLVDLGNAGVIDGEFAQNVVAKLFGSLGIDVDVEAMQARLEQAKADAATDANAPAGAGPAATGGPTNPALPSVDDLVNLDDLALEAIRELGDGILREAEPDLENEPDDALWMGLRVLLEAFDGSLHPLASGGRFGKKPDQPVPGAGDGGPSDEQVKAQVNDLLSQLKARDAATPKPAPKPPVHPAMQTAELTAALGALKPDDNVSVTLTNGMEVRGRITTASGGSAVIQTADGQYAILHDHLKGVASVTTSVAPAKPRAPRPSSRPPADRPAAAGRGAEG